MASPTSITVTVDDTEYSRYEKNKDVVTATVSISGGAAYVGEQVTVDLVKARLDRSAVVATATLTFNDPTDPVVPQEVTFVLKDIVDQDLINLVRHGQYFVRATSVSAPTVIGESEDFAVRIMTVKRFKEEYLFGINLIASDVKAPKFQPSSITGVEIVEVSKAHPVGFYELVYDYRTSPNTIRTLSWDGGPAVSITGPGTYILRRGGSGPLAKLAASKEYICVKVKALSLLPTAPVTEAILLEQKMMDDESLASYLDEAISWVENDALSGVFLEPTNVVTDRDPTTLQFAAGVQAPAPLFTDTDFDLIVSPLTYFLPISGSWVRIQTPYMQILRIDSLFGAIANTRVIDIDLEWIEHSMQGGLIQLVPFNQEIAFDFLGLIWTNAIRGAAEIPNFWHFNLIAGLRDTPKDLQDLIGKYAAIKALTIAGQALRPGIGSVSLGRDGVTESVSYVSGQFGNYSGPITTYQEWIDKNLPKFKAKYKGLSMAVV